MRDEIWDFLRHERGTIALAETRAGTLALAEGFVERDVMRVCVRDGAFV